MKIAIIGGSLSGSMAAIILGRAGHEVTVFERSKSGLVGRGGGLTTSKKVLDELKAQDIIDTDFPASPFYDLKMSKRTEEEPYLGVNPLTKAIDMHCVHWGGLWSNLVKRVPDTSYLRGQTLVDAKDTGDGVSLSFENGATVEADVALFCDGYNSMGRRLLFPDNRIEYRGYLVWRGTLPDSAITDHAPLADHPRYSYTTMKGSFVSFVVPSYEGSTKPGQRTINWAAYLPVPEDMLHHYLIDAQGKKRDGTVPSGALRPDLDEELKTLMRSELPDYYADILSKSSGNQLQLIYTNSLDAYGHGRMCLIGDAGMVVQPMTGSGLFKGYSNSRDLAVALAGTTDVVKALEQWSSKQTQVAHTMHDLGNQMEDAFIWNTVDLANTSPADCKTWWQSKISIPDAFSYFA